jgi:predicted GNAT family acetyltransferase
MTVIDNPELQRFELHVDGHIAFASYRRSPSLVTFTHAEVPSELQGRGVGSALAKGALALVEQSGDKVVPRCAFIAAYLNKHPELGHLLAP